MSSKKKVIELPKWVKERDANVEERRFAKKLTENHLKYKKTIEDKIITICIGAAGTAKTGLAAEVAVDLFKKNIIQQIILVRPLVECGPSLGFLPGNADEKMTFLIAPLVNALRRYFSVQDIETMKRNEQIIIVPISQMRGYDIHNSIVLADESQNLEYSQIKMLLTRMADGSKIVLNGDINQSDLSRDIRDNPLLKAIKDIITPTIPDDVGICVFGAEDVLRPDIVKIIAQRMGDQSVDIEELLGIIGLDEDLDKIPSYGKNIKQFSRKSKSLT